VPLARYVIVVIQVDPLKVPPLGQERVVVARYPLVVVQVDPLKVPPLGQERVPVKVAT